MFGWNEQALAARLIRIVLEEEATLRHGQPVQVEVKAVPQAIVEALKTHWAVNGDHVLLPVKLAKHFEEAL